MELNSLCFVAKLTPQGDGSFIVTPGKPQKELTTAQTAQVLCISRRAVYGLINEGKLDVRRPLRRKMLVSAESIERHRANTLDLEYWDRQGKGKI